MERFNIIAYLKHLVAINRLATGRGFTFSTCSGVQALEGLLTDMRDATRFVCVSDVTQGNTTYNGQSWSARRVATVFILSRYELGNAASYAAAINECRALMNQLLSGMLHDAERIANDTEASLRLDEVRSNELGGTFIDGCTGLYFMLGVDEPLDISYNAEDWLTDNA